MKLSTFGWKGTDKETAYFCAPLETTVTTLSQKAHDAHALNCWVSSSARHKPA